MTDEVIVSVICTAFNSFQYIRDALDSVLAQETDFSIEIIVHDDASTDGTTEVIKEYALNYPNIIPIIESENIFSKGEWLTRACLPYIKGRYVTILECDDYWTDHKKLQKQVDYLNDNPQMSACAHQTVVFNMISGETYLFSSFVKCKDLGVRDVASQAPFHTSSFLYRSEVLMEYERLLRGISFVYSGDLGLRIVAALHGKVHYSNEIMSVYRQYSNPESITTKKYIARDEETNKRINDCVCEILQRIDEYSNYKYHRLIQIRMARVIYALNGFEYKKGDIHKEYVRLFFLYILPIKTRIYVILVEYFPKLYEKYKAFISSGNDMTD